MNEQLPTTTDTPQPISSEREDLIRLGCLFKMLMDKLFTPEERDELKNKAEKMKGKQPDMMNVMLQAGGIIKKIIAHGGDLMELYETEEPFIQEILRKYGPEIEARIQQNELNAAKKLFNR